MNIFEGKPEKVKKVNKPKNNNLKLITDIAKKIREKNKDLKWNECIKLASIEYKKSKTQKK